MKTKIRTDLLRKLANHLYNPRTRTHRRHLRTFRFDQLAINTECGTVGCALGELPYCFPRQWKTKGHFRPAQECNYRFDSSLTPVLMVWPIVESVVSAAAVFFGLRYYIALSLFYPKEHSPNGILSNNSTASEVAAHLRKFCSKVEARRKSAKARND